MSRMSFEEDEGRENLSEEEQEWAKELADVIYEAGMSDYYAYILKQQPHAYLATVPEDSKGAVYFAAVQLMQARIDHEQSVQGSGMIH